MPIQKKLSNFHNKIKLGREDASYKDAREKDNSILEQLKKEFSEAGYPIIDNFIQGSHSTNTGIKYPHVSFDIDRALVLDGTQAPDDPLKPKELVYKVLEKRGFKNIKIKKPCVTAKYADLNLHIDIVVYRKVGDQYELALGKRHSDKNNKEWTQAAPKGLISWVNDKANYVGSSSDKLSQYKRLVRYTKRWRDINLSEDVSAKVFSIGLTVMLKENFVPSFSEEGKAQDLQALRDTVSRVINGRYFLKLDESNYTLDVPLPVTPFINIFDKGSKNTATQLRNRLSVMLIKLDQALAERSLKKQCEVLQGIFGDDFELAEDSDNKIQNIIYPTAGIVGTSQGA